MKKISKLTLLLFIVISSVQTVSAKNWFGNNHRWGGGGWGHNDDCNDWPEWTPMYWMEEMAGNDDDCFDGRYRYPAAYPPLNYPSVYQQSYPYAGAGTYALSPYAARRYAGPLGRGIYPPRLAPLRNGIYPPGNPMPGYGFSSMPRFPASSLGFGSPGGFSSPFSSMGGLGYPGMSPMSSYPPASPFSPMSPMGGLGGFGSPVSPWSMGSPMGGGVGTPWNSFGGSPFGGSGFSPFR
jgi:hypothetical protein